MALTDEQVKEMVAKMNDLEKKYESCRSQNELLMKTIMQGGGNPNPHHPRGLIQSKELSRVPVLKDRKQWADWSMTVKDTIMQRGHRAARVAMDMMEALPEKDATTPKVVLSIRAESLGFGVDKIDDET